jgi:hypothetical protein
MIKIQQKTQPFIWQVDNTHLLPNVSGQVRWNGNAKEFEVCDSLGNWHRINPTIELDSPADTVKVLNWAKKKMMQEERLEELAAEYPSIKDAKEKLDVLINLVQHR